MAETVGMKRDRRLLKDNFTNRTPLSCFLFSLFGRVLKSCVKVSLMDERIVASERSKR